MSDLNKNDEVDLLEFVAILWRAKVLILGSTIVAGVLGAMVHLFDAPRFESFLRVSVVVLPPHVTQQEAQTDFLRNFYDKQMFDTYVSTQQDAKLSYDNISQNMQKFGKSYLKANSQRLIVDHGDKSGTITFTIKTNDLNLVGDIFDYANYVNSYLTTNYQDRSNQLLNRYFEQYNSSYTRPDSIFERIAALEVYRLSDRMMSFNVYSPTFPKRVSQHKYITIVLASFLGAFLSILVVLIRSIIVKSRLKIS